MGRVEVTLVITPGTPGDEPPDEGGKSDVPNAYVPKALVDTGADRSLLPRWVFDPPAGSDTVAWDRAFPLLDAFPEGRIILANGDVMWARRLVVRMHIDGHATRDAIAVNVSDDAVEPLLGHDALQSARLVVDLVNHCVLPPEAAW